MDLTGFSTQVHDFNPGFVKDGVFWTVPIPHSAISIDLTAATASLKVTDLPVGDYTKVPNALMHGSSVPATITVDAEWSGVQGHETASGTDFSGNFIVTAATLAFSAKETGFTFVSDAASTSKSVIARMGTDAVGQGRTILEAIPAWEAGGGRRVGRVIAD